VTRGYPLAPRARERVDHPHHVGLWFNHGDVNGLDFWNNSEAVPEERRSGFGSILHRSVDEMREGAEGVLAVSSDWMGPDGAVLLTERTRFRFWAEDGVWCLERAAELRAVVKVLFRDNKEGTLGLRVCRELEQPYGKPERYTDGRGVPREDKVVDDEGVTGWYRSSAGLEGDAVWGTRGEWVRLAGEVAGEPTAVAILDHPRNPGAPTYWHARGYGLFAANPLGQRPLSGGKDELDLCLEPGGTAAFRYRAVVGPAALLDDSRLHAMTSAFARE
jgi:hypothetical protein